MRLQLAKARKVSALTASEVIRIGDLNIFAQGFHRSMRGFVHRAREGAHVDVYGPIERLRGQP